MKIVYNEDINARIAQGIEQLPSKQLVRGSIPLTGKFFTTMEQNIVYKKTFILFLILLFVFYFPYTNNTTSLTEAEKVTEDQTFNLNLRKNQFINYKALSDHYNLSPHMMFILVKSIQDTDIPIQLFLKLINEESQFHINAKNKNYSKKDKNKIISYDLGIAQLNSSYIPYFSEKYNNGILINPFDVETSLKIAALYLNDLYHETKDYKKAIMAYNCGLTRVQRNDIPIRTKKYANRIMNGYL